MAVHRSRIGQLRSYWLAVVVFISAFTQGYDAGVGGGVLTFPSFQRDFDYAKSSQTEVNALTVGLQQLGAFLACFLIYPVSDRFGRRTAILVSAAVFIVGCVLQTVQTGSLAAWYIARIVAGLGQGGYTVVTPTYSAEMAPKEIRGRLGSMYQEMYTIGIFTAYWVNYVSMRGRLIQGVQKNYGDTDSARWQIPISLQIVWGVLLMGGMLTLTESVRWYLKRDRPAEAWKALVWIRGDESEATQQEFDDMRRGIEFENASRSGFRVKELLEPDNRRRLTIASLVFLFQQGTGSGALASFGPQFFTLLVGKSDTNILLTGLFGAVKVVACTFFILFVADRFGRRTLLVAGSLAMFSCMLPLSLVLKFKTPPGGHIDSAGIATIALLYLNIAAYNNSWGPLPWAYVPELFSTRYRGVCMAISVSAHWAFSCCFALATPYMIRSLGWGTFLFFAVFDMVNAVGSWLIVKETRGKTLERVDHEFRVDAHQPVDRSDSGSPVTLVAEQDHKAT